MTDSHNRFLGNRALSPETLMMGYGYDPFLSERSLKPPIFQTSTFVFRSAQDGKGSSSWPTACGKSARMKSPD
jgi:methionine-gamma-lyase